jgi:hypothetical protein
MFLLGSRSAASQSLESRVRILLRERCSSVVFLVCCVGSGLCNELITLSEESYRVFLSNCVFSRNLNSEAAWAGVGM